MNFQPGNYYHVFNQGNNRQTVFHKEAYYGLFKDLYKEYIVPHCVTINYSLLPNHFHLLIYCDDRHGYFERQSIYDIHPIADGLRKTLSRYSRIVNGYEKRSGSIFRQNTKAKCLEDEIKLGTTIKSRKSYLEECFFYIHQNPLKAGLVDDLANWPHSAYAEYAGLRKDGICDLDRAAKDCGFSKESFRDRCHFLEPALR